MSVISLADAKKNLGFMTSIKSSNTDKKSSAQLLAEAFKALSKSK